MSLIEVITIRCFWPLVGRFNVYNCLAAMAVALSQIFLWKGSEMSQIPFVRGVYNQFRIA